MCFTISNGGAQVGRPAPGGVCSRRYSGQSLQVETNGATNRRLGRNDPRSLDLSSFILASFHLMPRVVMPKLASLVLASFHLMPRVVMPKLAPLVLASFYLMTGAMMPKLFRCPRFQPMDTAIQNQRRALSSGRHTPRAKDCSK